MKLSMPTIREIVAQELAEEAARYRRRAEECALSVILNPQSDGDRSVRDHLLRAETFKAAAAIAAGGAK